MSTNNLEDIVLTPYEVREILRLENADIIALCKKASIVPRRDRRGLTYFSYDEVKRLKQIKETKHNLVRVTPNVALEKIMNSFSEMENQISKNVSDMVDEKLNEKLKGVEDIALELIKLQGENAELKNKVTTLSKENVVLKTELNKYKKIGLGFFKKSKQQDFSI